MAAKFPPKLQEILIKHIRRIGYRNIHYKKTAASAHKGWAEWECSNCKGIFKREELHADHIAAVIDPETGFVDWNSFMERLFLGELQMLCAKKCHAEKTAKENERRHQVKSKK